MSRVFNPGFSRRKLLKALGVSAAVAPFVPTLESAAGGAEQCPKRFIMFFHPHGTVPWNWLPTGSPGPESSWGLSPILAPLSDYKDRMSVISGLEVKENPPYGGSHTVGPAYVSTGSPMEDGTLFQHMTSGGPHGWASNESVDQGIARNKGTNPPFNSLEFGVQPGGQHPGSILNYSGPGAPMSTEPIPQDMFDLVFGQVGLDAEAKEKLKTQRLSIIDIVKPQLDAVKTKVNQSDVFKIEAHLQGISEMETRLSAQYTCTPPDIGPELNQFDYNNTGLIAHQQIDIMVEALACQATDVATIMYRRGENDAFPYPHIGIANDHHGTSHAGDTDTVAQDELTQIYTWYAQEMKYLCDQLEARPEGEGTMLDNTLIFWCSEIAKGNNHTWLDMPFVLMGGAQGAVRTGYFHQFPSGTNHCRLLTALCHAMDYDVADFGLNNDGGGPLAGILT